MEIPTHIILSALREIKKSRFIVKNMEFLKKLQLDSWEERGALHARVKEPHLN
jgi:hypothetical protein